MDNNKNKSIFDKVLYKGMNGKDITVGKFIIGAILIGGGIFIALSVVI